MATKKPKTIHFRRKREGRTDYKKRLHLLLSDKPRLVVKVTNTKIITQVNVFNPKGDIVKVAKTSTELNKLGWKGSLKNLPAAYLTGILMGKETLKKGINEVILDTGLLSPKSGGKVYAFLQGVVESGLTIPHNEKVFPTEERIKGQHIENFDTNQVEKIKEKILAD
jgi:large subunit ribosomal protein L18